MIPAIRHGKLLEILSSNEIMQADLLMKELGISVSTLRRNLAKLEQEKKIVLLHGGGVKLTQKPIELRVIKTIALKNWKQSYFLLDSSKYGLIAMVKVANLEDYPILTEKTPEYLMHYSNFIDCGV